MQISIVGGGGRVGLPLAIALSRNGHIVSIIDKDQDRVEKINARVMPFNEAGAQTELEKLPPDKLFATNIEKYIKDSDICILIIGTPVLDDGTPSAKFVKDLVKDIAPYLSTVKLLLLRSTIFPGITHEIQRVLKDLGLATQVSYCPERIAEGSAMIELYELPQIIGADNEVSRNLSSEVFIGISPRNFYVTILEAELIKLFANTYRYIKFAIANEFFTVAVNSGASWENIWNALKTDYPRAKDLPTPGFAAGPCLVKDTTQLNFYVDNSFQLGKAAIEINESFPDYLISFLEKKYELKQLTIGILGMTFKGDVDDFRSSLSFRLKNLLLRKANQVLCSDSLLKKDYFISKELLIEISDVVIVATPHSEYKNLVIKKPIIDIWRVTSTESLI